MTLAISKTEERLEPRGAANRYASIDFLRGIAILIMIILHSISDTLDIDYYIGNLNNVAMVNFLALIALPFLGGLAGLFLMVSAIGNSIAMSRNLDRGHSPMSVMKKQVIGGMLVIFFAFVVEGLLGYHAVFGDIFRNLDDLSRVNFESARYRSYEIETLHTIGWAILINGIVHGILTSIFDAQTEKNKIIRSYWILSLLVLVLTPIVWWGAGQLIPGYPFEINPLTGREMYKPYIGTSPWYDFIIYFFLNPLAAPVEPILPYLAVSFVGTIIGMQMSKKEDFDRQFVRSYWRIGFVSFVVGFAGLVFTLISVMDEKGLDAMLDQYRYISYHRRWTSETGVVPDGSWLFQFLTLNGVTLMLVILAIRLVEYRNGGKTFAKNTSFVRRFGFIAFTAYAIQFIYFIFQYLVSVSLGQEPYSRQKWFWAWMVTLFAIIGYHLLMTVWEKKGFIGSYEWAIASIANRLSKVKKQVSFADENPRWYEIGKLDVERVFYKPNWLGFDAKDKYEDDLRLVKYSLIAGLVLFPFSFLALYLIRKLRKDNPDANLGKLYIFSLVEIALFVIGISFMLIFSLSDFGIVL